MSNDAENARWGNIIAEALKLDTQDVSLLLLEAGVNNSVYRITIDTQQNFADTNKKLHSKSLTSNPLESNPLTKAKELILRVPATGKSLMSYGAIGNKQIKHRFATYARSGYSPQLVDVNLPDGGVLCEFIEGRPAEFPNDLSLITRALAALHISDLDNTSTSVRSHSLQHQQATKKNTISYATMLKVITTRMQLIDDARFDDLKLPKSSVVMIRQLTKICMEAPVAKITAYENNPATPILPILKDANPSNFIITGDNAKQNQRAMVVDIEGDFYGMPLIDVGHSSLFSASMWAYADIVPLPVTDIVKLYEEYYEALTELHSKKLAEQARPPTDIICSIRYATLGRCLGWMLMLLYLTEVKGVVTPPDKLARAKLILSPEKLQLALSSEQEIAKLI